LSAGVVGAAFAPTLAAVSAIAALITDCTLDLDRDEPAPPAPALTEESATPLTS
jgi:hypothetical protein